MNADLPLIDISSKLQDVDREVTGYSELTDQRSRDMIAGLDAVVIAYVTLTSSHLEQLRRACELTGNGNDIIRSVGIEVNGCRRL